MTLTARPTTYRGVQMRSRLEAKFAALLDADGVGWLYEPRAYANESGQYLPDFQVLTMDGKALGIPVFIEVRPTIDRAYRAMTQMPLIWDSEPEATLLICVPDVIWFLAVGHDRCWRIQ